MTTILHIASSSNLHNSVSREIGTAAVEGLKKANAGAKVVMHDLVQNPVPHIAPAFVDVLYTKPDAPELALSRTLVAEILASDIIVLEAPMYNFNIPSVLKAWIDHIVRAGLTFTYSASGVEGLLKGKKVILALGRGGMYTEGPMKVMDYQETYLRAVLGFVGITDIDTVLIEGVGMGVEKREEALAAGGSKLAGVTYMVDPFNKVGLGQWFRYFTGSLEVVGAIGLLIPRYALYAAVLLAIVMVGATIAHITVLGSSPIAAIVLLVLCGTIAYLRKP